MKSFLVAGLLGFASAAPVHKFIAESNYICRKCESAVDYLATNGDASSFDMCNDHAGFEFTTVCAKVASEIPLVHDLLFAGKSSHDICESIKLCGDTSDSEYETESAMNKDIIYAVNSDEDLPWQASVESLARWDKKTLKDVRRTLGTVVDKEHTYRLAVRQYDSSELKYDLPTDFDSRTQWSSCADVIGHIRDQSACGCCWAFGSTEAYNDRLCIADSGSFQQLLSVEDTCACCNFISCDSMGCDGGQPTEAWEWFASNGIVTGGDYDDIGHNDTCDPFTLPPCAHHVNSTEYPPCPTDEYSTPTCKKDCQKEYSKSWDEDIHKAVKAYSLRTVDDIMTDIYSYGTVTAAFTVYEDFLSYTSGVYIHKYGQELGGHAIKIFGWGVDGTEEYWWCANSWNDSWGDQGFFKILKGVDECGIESDVSAGHAS